MIPIKYVVGDATRPAGEGLKVIAHCCNDIGAWGAGFVIALSRRWPEPEQRYLESFDVMTPGGVQFVEVAPDIIVANIIGQHGCGSKDGVPPIRYEWLRKGFGAIANLASEFDSSVHMPRIGCGLAGGEWKIVEALITECLSERDIAVSIYDLPARP